MRHLVLAAVALALAPPAAIGADDLTPEQVGEIFCAARLADDMEPMEALLTPDLWAAIAAAFDQNEAWAAANPGEKPPLGDGVPWQSWPDRASECMVTEVSYEMDEKPGLDRVPLRRRTGGDLS